MRRGDRRLGLVCRALLALVAVRPDLIPPRQRQQHSPRPGSRGRVPVLYGLIDSLHLLETLEDSVAGAGAAAACSPAVAGLA
jgi:hypothetical protein